MRDSILDPNIRGSTVELIPMCPLFRGFTVVTHVAYTMILAITSQQ